MRHLDISSRVQGPIDELDRLERSAIFAEISMVSYLPGESATPLLHSMGFSDVCCIEHDGAEVFVMGTDVDVVVVCRGTEPNEWNDIRADVTAWTELTEPAGRVHRGFNAKSTTSGRTSRNCSRRKIERCGSRATRSVGPWP